MNQPFPYSQYVRFIGFDGRKSGVYSLRTSKGIYIGSTSNQIRLRAKDHIKRTIAGTHYNAELSKQIEADIESGYLIELERLDDDIRAENRWIAFFVSEDLAVLNLPYGRARK